MEEKPQSSERGSAAARSRDRLRSYVGSILSALWGAHWHAQRLLLAVWGPVSCWPSTLASQVCTLAFSALSPTGTSTSDRKIGQN